MTDGIAGRSRSPCSRRSPAPGPITTYRSLLAGVYAARVEREVGEQRPVLEPVDVGGPADLLVFDGTILRAEATFHMTRSATGFEVDAGSIHGLRSASGGEAFDLACLVPGTARGRRSGPRSRGRAVPERRRAAWLAARRYRVRGGHRLRATAHRGRALRPGRAGRCRRVDLRRGALECRTGWHAVAVRRGRGRGRRGRRRRSTRHARRRRRRRLYRRSDRGRPSGPGACRERSGVPHPPSGWDAARGRSAGTRCERCPSGRRAPRAHRTLGAGRGLGGHPSRLRDAIRLELFETRSSGPCQPADDTPLVAARR